MEKTKRLAAYGATRKWAMSITGNVKFFGPNQIDENATFTFTSASTALASYLYDRNRNSKLTSVGSNDATNEDLVIDFVTSKTFNRIFVDNHNIKTGNVQYWDGAAYQDFSTVVSWVANATTTSYFEFNSVTATKIRLRATTTMVVNAQKFIGELIAFLELGTMLSNPSSAESEYIDKSVQNMDSTGGSIFILFGKKYSATWLFTDADATDAALLLSLKDLNTPFFIYPCGGSGQNEIGFRSQDIFLVNYVNNFAPKLKSNMYALGVSISMEVKEV